MSDDLMALYSGRILALAADIPHLGRLAAPQGSATCRSPVCGSVVTADVVMENGRVRDFAQEVSACALGQASAAILGRVATGRSAEEIREARQQLDDMLRQGAAPPAPPFEGYEVLIPARDYRNRHHSILLALDALLGAIETAKA